MMAALLTSVPSTALDLRSTTDPSPGPGEVLVKVSACGICGTDLHLMEGHAYKPQLPFVLGHELVGTVVGTAGGGGGDKAALVAPTLFSGCGRCPPCLNGDERLCLQGPDILGVLGRPGGFAEYVPVRQSQLVVVPPPLDAIVAASLVDAGPTARNASRLALTARSYGAPRHLVVGGGPVGLLVAALLAVAGQSLVVVEPNPLRRRELSRRGLEVLGSLPDGEQQYTTVVDCVGRAALFARALPLLAPHGRYICVGYAPVPEADFPTVAHRELEISGVRSGNRGDLETVLSMVARGEVEPPPVTTWGLSQINDAFEALRAGEVVGKAVIVTEGTPS